MRLHPDRVHIVPVQHEYDRVVEPLLEHGADWVYLLFDRRDAEYPPYYDELEERLVDYGLTRGETLITIDCDHGDPYAVFGLVTTIAAEHPDESVAVNIGTGGKLASIGAALGCMDDSTPATAYFPHPESLAYDGDQQPRATGYTGDTQLIDYPIDSPTPQQLACMAIVATERTGTALPKKRTLIERTVEIELHEEGLIPFAGEIIESTGGVSRTRESVDWSADFTSAEQVSAYTRLDNRIVEPLVGREYLAVDEQGRSSTLELTETGRQTLLAFRHKITGIAEVLHDIYPRPGSPGATVPDWLRPRFGR